MNKHILGIAKLLNLPPAHARKFCERVQSAFRNSGNFPSYRHIANCVQDFKSRDPDGMIDAEDVVDILSTKHTSKAESPAKGSKGVIDDLKASHNVAGLFQVLCHEKDNHGRRQVAFALELIVDVRDIGVLISVLKDRDKNVRVRDFALNLLVKIGESAVKPLVDLLQNNDDIDIHQAANKALKQLQEEGEKLPSNTITCAVCGKGFPMETTRRSLDTFVQQSCDQCKGKKPDLGVPPQMYGKNTFFDGRKEKPFYQYQK